MDVNGTRFHLLLGRSDWARRCGLADDFASDEGAFSWDDARNELTLGRRLFAFRSATQNRVPHLDERRGAAVDAYGNVYWIDANRNDLFIRPAGNERASRFWSLGEDCATCAGDGSFTALDPKPAAPLTLSGLAVTSDHFLVAGVLDPPGLLVFDLQSGGSPRQLVWPSGVAFSPFDMTASPDGGIVILDREHGRVWQLDRTLRIVPAAAAAPAVSSAPPLFTPMDGDASRVVPPSPAITDDFALDTGLTDLVAIEILRDGSLLLMRSLDGDSFSTFHRYLEGVPTGELLDTSVAREVVDDPAAFTFLGQDFAYVRDRAGVNDPHADVLYVAGGSGDQAVAFAISFKEDSVIAIEALREFHPMRLFSGKALLPSGGDALYDLGDRWIPLVAQRRNAYLDEAEFTVTFDGKEPDCTWHRLFLDACIPPDCRVSIFSRAAGDRDLLASADEYPEHKLERRKGGSEMPWTNDVNDSGRRGASCNCASCSRATGALRRTSGTCASTTRASRISITTFRPFIARTLSRRRSWSASWHCSKVSSLRSRNRSPPRAAWSTSAARPPIRSSGSPHGSP
jgi:hypothetical protein